MPNGVLCRCVNYAELQPKRTIDVLKKWGGGAQKDGRVCTSLTRLRLEKWQAVVRMTMTFALLGISRGFGLAKETRDSQDRIHVCCTSCVQFIKANLHTLQCKHNRHTICYMFRHFLMPPWRKAALMMELKKCRSPDDGTQAVPKHVGDCVPLVFILQFM